MNDKIRNKLIKKCIDRVFIPTTLPLLYEFLENYRKRVIYEHDYNKAFGIKINTGQVVLNLSKPSQQLSVALTELLKNV